MKQFRNPINKYFCILKPNFTGGEDKVKVNDLEDIVRLILKLYNDVPDNLKVWIDNHYTNPTAFGKEYQYAFMVYSNRTDNLLGTFEGLTNFYNGKNKIEPYFRKMKPLKNG